MEGNRNKIDHDIVRFHMSGVPVPDNRMWDQVVRVLSQQGLDCSLHGTLFRPVMVPFWIKVRGFQILIFGRRGVDEGLGIDAASGKVVDVVDRPGYEMVFVNTTMELFASSSSWFLSRYPFYGSQPDEEVLESVSGEVRKRLGEIDPPCVAPDTFWDTICWDVAIGDWDVVDEGEHVDWESVHNDMPPSWWWTSKSGPEDPTFNAVRTSGPDRRIPLTDS